MEKDNIKPEYNFLSEESKLNHVSHRNDQEGICRKIFYST